MRKTVCRAYPLPLCDFQRLQFQAIKGAKIERLKISKAAAHNLLAGVESVVALGQSEGMQLSQLCSMIL